MSSRPRTIVYVGTSLDGFIARPDGGIDWLDDPSTPADEGEDFGWSEFIPTVDHMVLGRATFELLLTFDMWVYGELPMTVLSTTLKEVPERLRGQVELSSQSPAALLAELGRRGRKKVYLDGGKTVQSFLAEDLVDELVVSRLPVLIGEGIPLFGPVPGDLRWTLESTKVFDKQGIVKTTYLRRRADAGAAETAPA